jgi:hypothetical protein
VLIFLQNQIDDVNFSIEGVRQTPIDAQATVTALTLVFRGNSSDLLVRVGAMLRNEKFGFNLTMYACMCVCGGEIVSKQYTTELRLHTSISTSVIPINVYHGRLNHSVHYVEGHVPLPNVSFFF